MIIDSDVDYDKLHSFDKEFLLNGCGPTGGPTLNLIFKRACGIHDLGYLTGGTEKHREMADNEFGKNLACAVGMISWWRFISRFLMRRAARLYHGLVVRFGASSFTYRYEDQWDEQTITVAVLLEEMSARQEKGESRLAPLLHILHHHTE